MLAAMLRVAIDIITLDSNVVLLTIDMRTFNSSAFMMGIDNIILQQIAFGSVLKTISNHRLD